MKRKIKNEEGVCPNCGSFDLEYEASELDENMVFYPFKCLKCKKEGKEWYNIVFTEILINE